MSTLSGQQTNGDAGEEKLPQAKTTEKIWAILQQFDVLTTKGEKYLITYAFPYFFGLYLLDTIKLIPLLVHLHLPITLQAILAVTLGEQDLFTTVGISLIAVTFNLWRLRVPSTLQDLFARSRLSLSVGDVNQQYLGFLEHYRNALRNPARYLVIGCLMILMAIYLFLPSFVFGNLFYSNLVDNAFVLINLLLALLFDFGGMYCVGIIMWTWLVSGRYLRKLTRTFEFNINPRHSDNCGGLKKLGDFCFGLVSPGVIGIAYFCGSSVILFTYASPKS